VQLRGSIYLDGQMVEARSGAIFDNFGPTTGEVLNQVASGNAADINAAVASGRRAFTDGDWSQASPAPLVCDEIFGPVLSVLTFDDEDEAVAIANGTRYGLAASVWTSNLSRALRTAERLHAGTVSVNAVDAGGTVVLFGGFKESGIGCYLSLHSFDKYPGLKTTWIKY